MKNFVNAAANRVSVKKFLKFNPGKFASKFILAVTILSTALAPLSAQVQDFIISIDDKVTKAGKEDVKDGRYGEGTRELFDVTFKVKITNTKQDELKEVSLRLIPFFYHL